MKGLISLHVILLTIELAHARSVSKELVELVKNIKGRYDIDQTNDEEFFKLLGIKYEDYKDKLLLFVENNDNVKVTDNDYDEAERNLASLENYNGDDDNNNLVIFWNDKGFEGKYAEENDYNVNEDERAMENLWRKEDEHDKIENEIEADYEQKIRNAIEGNKNWEKGAYLQGNRGDTKSVKQAKLKMMRDFFDQSKPNGADDFIPNNIAKRLYKVEDHMTNDEDNSEDKFNELDGLGNKSILKDNSLEKNQGGTNGDVDDEFMEETEKLNEENKWEEEEEENVWEEEEENEWEEEEDEWEEEEENEWEEEEEEEEEAEEEEENEWEEEEEVNEWEEEEKNNAADVQEENEEDDEEKEMGEEERLVENVIEDIEIEKSEESQENQDDRDTFVNDLSVDTEENNDSEETKDISFFQWEGDYENNREDEDFGVVDYLEKIKIEKEGDNSDRQLYEDVDDDHAEMDYEPDDEMDDDQYEEE